MGGALGKVGEPQKASGERGNSGGLIGDGGVN